ncbi:hypothetical protein O9Z70_06245 [Devosia sp. YIM 151766]|uniref:hypothetical protein n=1 Tax=Devosia sp. YIM 151766 TaxID=3017325 RepID=UPI00255C8C63|nr:hypothetical protein [Devosia sp. YIM 151766]WIY54117.1 hypothetical protein O9Z70_06245 [Devosia sp. YIM 151766]
MDWVAVGSFAAVASVLIALAGVYYSRGATIAQTKPSYPAIETFPITPMAGIANWYGTSFIVRNVEPVTWHIDHARVTMPVGTKLAIYGDLPKMPRENNWDEQHIDATGLGRVTLTNSRKLGIVLAPAGHHKGTAIMGENDRVSQSLYLFIPPRSEASSISIDLTLRSSAIPDRTFSRTVTHKIITASGSAT